MRGSSPSPKRQKTTATTALAPRKSSRVQTTIVSSSSSYPSIDSDQKSGSGVHKRSTLAEMVHSGLLQPGKGVLHCKQNGKKHCADLKKNGEICYKQKLYYSPSSWSIFIKKRSDNGWTSITYQGKKLSEWRKDVGSERRVDTSNGGGDAWSDGTSNEVMAAKQTTTEPAATESKEENVVAERLARKRVLKLEKGWTLEIATRKRKKSASNKDVSYIDPHGKKYRSWSEVKRVAWYLQSSSEEEEDDDDDETP